MSWNYLTVIPKDPFLVPPEANREAAFKLLCSLLPGAEEAELKVSETPEFVDCGGNFEGVFCPFCGADLADSWSDYMERWWKGDHRVLDMETPCCGRATTLNDLNYPWPQGFACVRFKFMNPAGLLGAEECAQIEAALGTPIQVIWAHL